MTTIHNLNPEKRPGARVLLFDCEKNLLLFETSTNPSDSNDEIIWMTPGGASELNEKPSETALRELYEETGFSPPLKKCVWVRDWVWYHSGYEKWYDTHEYFYVAELTRESPKIKPTKDDELVTLMSYKWMNLEQISQLKEKTSPIKLKELLIPIITGNYPEKPLSIGQ
ncbi:MAG: NUDIX domain-containing protein [Dehalococcoidia bacterium]|jgi:8-oxo-dGTP pyrophosphatase MutT (NUDIX family)|nr:NUDIX domain-containing protein [Dehalococcoidia bacterium]